VRRFKEPVTSSVRGNSTHALGVTSKRCRLRAAKLDFQQSIDDGYSSAGSLETEIAAAWEVTSDVMVTAASSLTLLLSHVDALHTA